MSAPRASLLGAGRRETRRSGGLRPRPRRLRGAAASGTAQLDGAQKGFAWRALEDSFCLGGGPRTQKNVAGKLRLHFGERSFPGFCSYIEVPEDLCLRARDAHHLVV